MDPLHSTENPAFKALKALLGSAKARRESGRAVVEGPHLVAEALKAGRARELWVTPEASASAEGADIGRLAREAALRERLVDARLLQRAASTEAPQGWMAVVEAQAPAIPQDATLWLALDGLQDPGNLGSLLRTAWAARAVLLLGPGCADPWSPKVLRAGAGAQFHAPFKAVADLPAALCELGQSGVAVYGSSPRAAQTHAQAPLDRPSCLVLGAEGPGLSPAVAGACTATLRIPYPGDAESLNVAVAGGLLLFEALRQRST
jgi:TrmH family RNA methyltransferase